jgi:transcriptional regulator with XRE-family HTH domain
VRAVPAAPGPGRTAVTGAGPVPRGEVVRRARRRRGLSLQLTADLIGHSAGWLSMIENGHLELDKISDVVALAELLQVPVAHLADLPACQGCPKAPAAGPGQSRGGRA